MGHGLTDVDLKATLVDTRLYPFRKLLIGSQSKIIL